MRLGLGLNQSRMTDDDMRFARQAGVTHLHVGLHEPQPTTERMRTSRERYPDVAHSDPDDADWSYENMRDLRKVIEEHGMVFEAVTGIEPAHWYDVLLDDRRRVGTEVDHRFPWRRDVARISRSAPTSDPERDGLEPHLRSGTLR